MKLFYLKTKYQLYETKFIIKNKISQMSMIQLFVYSNWILLIWHSYGFVTSLLQGNLFWAGVYLLFAIINVIVLFGLCKIRSTAKIFRKTYFSF